MNYEQFKAHFLNLLNAQLRNGERFSCRTVRFENETYRDELIREDDPCCGLCIEPYYQFYRNGAKITDLVADAAQTSDGYSLIRTHDKDRNRVFAYQQDSVYFRLMNYDRNAVTLRTIPHLRYLDLAVVFYTIQPAKDGYFMELIDSEQKENRGLSKYQLWKMAKKNTLRDYPIVTRPLSDVLGEQDRSPLLLLTNKEGLFGAIGLYYREILERCFQDCGGSFFILPSSVHELLLMPESAGFEKRDLKAIVSQVNAEHVPQEIFLSDHIYHYSKENGLCML